MASVSGLNCTMPKGVVAPGNKLLPPPGPPPVPMIVFTSPASPAGFCARRTHVAIATKTTSIAILAAARANPSLLSYPFWLFHAAPSADAPENGAAALLDSLCARQCEIPTEQSI